MNTFFIILLLFSLRVYYNNVVFFIRNYVNIMVYNIILFEVNSFNVILLCKYVSLVVFYVVLCYYVGVIFCVF